MQLYDTLQHKNRIQESGFTIIDQVYADEEVQSILQKDRTSRQF